MSEICDKVEKAILDKGFKAFEQDNGDTHYKGVMVFPELAGQLSNGLRNVTISICKRGRYIGRLDGWGKIEKDIDLRTFWNNEAEDVLVELFK